MMFVFLFNTSNTCMSLTNRSLLGVLESIDVGQTRFSQSCIGNECTIGLFYGHSILRIKYKTNNTDTWYVLIITITIIILIVVVIVIVIILFIFFIIKIILFIVVVILRDKPQRHDLWYRKDISIHRPMKPVKIDCTLTVMIGHNKIFTFMMSWNRNGKWCYELSWIKSWICISVTNFSIMLSKTRRF